MQDRGGKSDSKDLSNRDTSFDPIVSITITNVLELDWPALQGGI